MSNIKLADFGLSIMSEINFIDDIKCGTPGNIAPEILSKGLYSKKADMFSVGCILYNMLTGDCIFEAKTLQQILKLNKACLDIPAKINKLPHCAISGELKHFLG